MKNRIISTLLAVLMLISAFTLVIGAEDTATFTPEYNTKSNTPTINYLQGRVDPEDTGATATSKEILTPHDKLETMDLRLEKDGYRLYVDAYSGEVATECIATGEILFSNPYDVGSSKATDDIKSQLLSQIHINFTDIVTGDPTDYWSYEWASTRGQIIVKNIKGGIRVEYTIGREEAKLLVPALIEKESFETKILNKVKDALSNDEDGYTAADDFTFKKISSYYSLKDVNDPTMSQSVKAETMKSFPITKKMAVYVLETNITANEKARVEQIIKTYCPEYTYEDLDEDHLKTEYESEDENPPLFKLALEYTLDEMGLLVRLPANGIRFAESLYRLDSIEILPYMGAGRNPNSGYTFYPDGSGTLFDFEETAALGTSTTVAGKVYGVDYAYHEITLQNQEIIRYPVFGVYENETLYVDEDDGGETVAPLADTTTGTTATEEETRPTYQKERGFVAIVEEGDSMMELTVSHAVRTNEYNTVKMAVYPRPQDTYNVADAISVGSNDTWTVVSARKYTGNYKIRYMMLTSDAVAKEKGLTDTYEASYVGMAKAYRDYLVKNGTLTKLTSADVKSDIPLYIETFGAMETTERFLSIPFEVMTPLTTFADINTMYDDLAAKGVTNINFILKGFTKGGITSPTAPYHLKWESAVEKGGMDFEDLLTVATQKGFQVFPDVDFAFISQNTLFDGVNLKEHAVKTIDDRYTSKREYSATKQTHISYFELALSPAYFSHFYEKFTENYLKYQPMGISVSTLGSYLNSDFDEEDPYNRADAKDFTVQAFEYLDKNYGKVMTSGGNAFSWKYVDYITDIALDSSRYAQSSASVPFLGIVLHGYVEYAGTPINMEGNVQYYMLKAIENGAALKFILSYQNTDNLKNYETLSQYYSVRYDIWYDDVVSLYTELNSVLKDLQTSTIETHKYLEGTRIPDIDELEADAAQAVLDAIEKEAALAEAEKEALRKQLNEARKLILKSLPEFIVDDTDGVETSAEILNKNIATLTQRKADLILVNADLEVRTKAAAKAQKDYEDAMAYLATLNEADDPDSFAWAKNDAEAKKQASYDANAALAELQVLGTPYEIIGDIYKIADETIKLARELVANYETAATGFELIKSEGAYTEKIRNELELVLNSVKSSYEAIANAETGIEATATAIAKEAFVEYTENSDPDAGYTGEEETVRVPHKDYVYDDGSDDAVVEDDAVEAKPYNKYESDSNKIVYMEYVNSETSAVTALILNFNNYAVVVTADNGISYTLEAYGYIVINA